MSERAAPGRTDASGGMRAAAEKGAQQARGALRLLLYFDFYINDSLFCASSDRDSWIHGVITPLPTLKYSR